MSIPATSILSRLAGDAQMRESEVSEWGVPAQQTSGGMREIERPRAQGKFLYVAGKHFWIRGVTYGTFRPNAAGLQFPDEVTVRRDLRAMADAGFNSIRVYTAPPQWLLDVAGACGLRVMLGLPWEQHITFLDDTRRVQRIIRELRATVRRLAAHPAILCYVVGNEIPASVVRWYRKRQIEKFIAKLCYAVKSEDPSALTTYVNFPTTEYLDLPFLDFVAFNVYLEQQVSWRSYLARLQNLAGERPLVIAEVGLDSRRNGEGGQATSLKWQLATAFQAGCAGEFVFAWTDDLFRGVHDILDWDFGLTARDRRPKAALQTVSSVFAELPFAVANQWPKVSVIVCSYNGESTIGETLAALKKLEYPNYEVIVIDDGSTDQTSAIAREYDVRLLIHTENNGLSVARNHGLNNATGEIIAYIDDDAYPDPFWLHYLVDCFQQMEYAGVGGPNLPPQDDGMIADCVANAPGGPVHVMLTDEIAEHIPGCNMAFRRERLLAIGGFDPRFRVAGDDVDICWRLQEQGWTLGFAPSAVVWHHRRNSFKSYFKQQRGYAKAEALLAEKWPAKYNGVGHLTWRGRLYGRGRVESLFSRSRIYHGVWGSAPFQSVYERSSDELSALSLMPEWYFLLLMLSLMNALGMSWTPLLWSSPLLATSLGLTLFQAIRAGGRACFGSKPATKFAELQRRVLVVFLHVIQPGARLLGRIQHGMGPWNFQGFSRFVSLWTTVSLWSVRWEPIEARLSKLASILREAKAPVASGGDYDKWDLSVSGGLFGAIRVLAMVEEHGSGQQLCRFRAWPQVPATALAILVVLITIAGLAGLDRAAFAGSMLALAAGTLGFRIYSDCALAMSQWRAAIKTYVRRNSVCLSRFDSED